MERNSAGSTVYSASRSHSHQSSAGRGIPNRRLGASVISRTSSSSAILPVRTSPVYSAGKAVSSPTIPKALPASPRLFSSALWGA